MKYKQVGFECINNQIDKFKLQRDTIIIVTIDMKSTYFML